MSGSSKLPRLTVAVLQGGVSAEREVSLQSGRAVSRALRDAQHVVVDIDPAQIDLRQHDWREIDVAFLALHGAAGEDGEVQKLLQAAGVAYTGSGPAASAHAFSKLAAKQIFVQRGVPTAPWVALTAAEPAKFQREKAQRLGLPLVVKPDQQGSSLGVTMVNHEKQLDSALELAFQFGQVCLLEQAIVGAEWTVGLLDEHSLPPIRIGTNHDFFDYQAKYHDEQTQYHFEDSPLSPTASLVSRVAVDACAAVGTRGVARVDLMVDRFGRPFVLEINTIPGFTDHSLVPKAALRAGLNFTDLCEWCLVAARRQASLRKAA